MSLREIQEAERARREQALRSATKEGWRTGFGDETAILCSGCGSPMLILAVPGIKVSRIRCIPCGPVRRAIRRSR